MVVFRALDIGEDFISFSFSVEHQSMTNCQRKPSPLKKNHWKKEFRKPIGWCREIPAGLAAAAVALFPPARRGRFLSGPVRGTDRSLRQNMEENCNAVKNGVFRKIPWFPPIAGRRERQAWLRLAIGYCLG